MMPVEEDGDEIFVPIKDTRCCGLKLWPSKGFWRCPSCLRSFGPVDSEETQNG